MQRSLRCLAAPSLIWISSPHGNVPPGRALYVGSLTGRLSQAIEEKCENAAGVTCALLKKRALDFNARPYVQTTINLRVGIES